MTLCKHGHDKDELGVVDGGACRECGRIRSREYQRQLQGRAKAAGLTKGRYRMQEYRRQKAALG